MNEMQKSGLNAAWYTGQMCRCRECYCCTIFLQAPKEAPPTTDKPNALDAWVAKYMGEQA